MEAEDKILGPLTLRQFIYGMIAALFFYLSFLVVSKGVAFLLILFLPPALFCGFFAVPFGRDQPTEVWAIAKLRFWILPRKRIWNQSGVKEMVTITVPKKVERVLTDGLSQNEVKSRLQALANTIDSRGWAIRNVAVYAQPASAVTAADSTSERLIDLNNMPREVAAEDTSYNASDIMDANSPIAHQVDTMITQSTQAHHQELMDRLNNPQPTPTPNPLLNMAAPTPAPSGSNGWFIGHGADTPSVPPPPSAPDVPPEQETPEEADLVRELKSHSNKQSAAYGHMRTVQPLGSQPAAPPQSQPASPPSSTTVTGTNDPAILALANNDDLNVATLAREAHKAKGDDPDEVVISLH